MQAYARIGKASGVEAPLYMFEGDALWRWPFEKRRDGREAPRLQDLKWVNPTTSLKVDSFTFKAPSAEEKAAFKAALTPEGEASIRVLVKAARSAAKARRPEAQVKKAPVVGELITDPPAYLLA